MRTDDERTAPRPYYPLFVSLDRRVCLVIGGGAVGERKVRGLLQCGASVRIVSRELTPWLKAMCERGAVTYAGSDYEPGQFENIDLVFAASSDPALNQRVAADASEGRVWCNMATDPDLGSFIIPAVVQRGPLTIAVSTSGLSPAVARNIREKLDQEFGPSWQAYLNLMGLLRKAILARGLESSENRRLLTEIADLPVVEWIEGGDVDRILDAIHRVCRPLLDLEELARILDKEWKPFSSSSPHYAIAVEPSDT